MEMMKACTPHEYKTKNGESKTFWHHIGTGWVDWDTQRIRIQLAANPVNGQINLFPREQRQQAPQQQNLHNEDPW